MSDAFSLFETSWQVGSSIGFPEFEFSWVVVSIVTVTVLYFYAVLINFQDFQNLGRNAGDSESKEIGFVHKLAGGSFKLSWNIFKVGRVDDLKYLTADWSNNVAIGLFISLVEWSSSKLHHWLVPCRVLYLWFLWSS